MSTRLISVRDLRDNGSEANSAFPPLSLPFSLRSLSSSRVRRKAKKKGISNSGKEEKEQQQQLDTKTITKQVPSKRCFLWVPYERGGRGRWNQGAIGASTEVRLHRRRRRFAGRQSSHKKKYNGNANEPQTGQTYGQKHGQADRRAEDKTEP